MDTLRTISPLVGFVILMMGIIIIDVRNSRKNPEDEHKVRIGATNNTGTFAALHTLGLRGQPATIPVSNDSYGDDVSQ
ncbi:MAG: hypothetical protein JWN38_30 [Candidatus Saccharibacteria bacterium]|nr:hypothetical protein [Candidatus Saccharibacteria bacterium]